MVTRCIYVMCGSVQINGHVFSDGLRRLRLPPSLLTVVGPVAYLIKGALFWRKYELGSRGIRPGHGYPNGYRFQNRNTQMGPFTQDASVFTGITHNLLY